MNIYPHLTQVEQCGLPALIAKPTILKSKFDDSTHQLWQCESDNGLMILKLCDHDAIAKSDFWFGTNHLFGADFPNSLAEISKTHTLLTEKGLFVVPDFVASKANRFVLNQYLAGHDVDASHGSDEMVTLLAKHVAKLHQVRFEKWGNLHAPAYSVEAWKERLKQTLMALAARSAVPISDKVLNNVMSKVASVQESIFAPIMLDLRWDQFRVLDNALLKDEQISVEIALIDLDAFVVGPVALELVLMEYLLTKPQFGLFKTQYSAMNTWPDYSQQKPCYQLLLFLMNVLGEKDLDRWMNQF
jgi:hypothetical protein